MNLIELLRNNPTEYSFVLISKAMWGWSSDLSIRRRSAIYADDVIKKLLYEHDAKVDELRSKQSNQEEFMV